MMRRKPRRQELLAVSVRMSDGFVLREISPVNLYLLPGVRYALHAIYPDAEIHETPLGMGHMPGVLELFQKDSGR